MLDGKIYVIAGFNAQGQSTPTVEVYDPSTNAWQLVRSLPEGRDHAMAAAYGGKIYVFGGGNGGPTRSAFVYDPARDAWNHLPEMPFRRTAGGAAVLGYQIIVAGGTGDSPTTAMVFDPASQRWSEGPPLAAPREHLAMTTAGGRVYVTGGRWDGVLSSTNEVLAAPNAAWRQLAPLPTARGGTGRQHRQRPRLRRWRRGVRPHPYLCRGGGLRPGER